MTKYSNGGYNNFVNMNKNLLIVIGGIGLALIVGAGVFLSRSSQDPTSPLQQDTFDTSPKKEEKSGMQNIRGNFMDLIALGVPMECTFNFVDESATTTGKVFVSGKNMRGDFELTLANGDKMSSSTIRDDEYIYTWTSLGVQGTKLKVDEAEKYEDEDERDDDQTSIEDEDVDYSCKPWIVDRLFFQPPDSIDFIDMTQQLQEMEEAMEQVEEAKCNACNQIPAGPEREACRESMGCN